MTAHITTFDLSRSVNETVLAMPQTLEVFAALGMDTCCRGAMPLSSAALAVGVSEQELLTALESLQQNPVRASSSNVDDK